MAVPGPEAEGRDGGPAWRLAPPRRRRLDLRETDSAAAKSLEGATAVFDVVAEAREP